MDDDIDGMTRADWREHFEGQAEWRRQKADEYPDDAQRNLEAAADLDGLAASCEAISDVTLAEFNGVYKGLAKSDDLWVYYEELKELTGTIHIHHTDADGLIQSLSGSLRLRVPAEAA